MSPAGISSKAEKQLPLPRGPYALPPEQVAKNQRERILAAMPEVVAEHGYDGATVAHVVERAGVARGAFYKQFKNKRECFAAAHEMAQERLLGVLTLPCYAHSGLPAKVGGSLGAALDLFAAEPALARLLTVEAPAAGAEIAKRHHQWLARYGSLLRLAAIDAPGVGPPERSVEATIVGGVVSHIAGEVLEGRAESLPDLVPDLAPYVLAFYRQPAVQDESVTQLASSADSALA